MKKLILIFCFLFAGLLFAQQGTGKYTMNTADDTVTVYNSQNKYLVFITVQDSGGATDDSLYAEIKTLDGTDWGSVGLKDLVTDEIEKYAIPGAGNTKTYLLNKPNATQIRFTGTTLTGNVYIWVEFINI